MNAHPRPRTLFENWKMRSLMVMLGVAALSSTARADGKARLNAEASLLGGVFRTTHIGFETTVRVEPSIGVRGVLGIQLDRRGTTFRLGGVLDVVSVGDAEPLALGGELQVDHLVSEHWRLGGRVSVSAADNSNALVAVGPRARALDHIVAESTSSP